MPEYSHNIRIRKMSTEDLMEVARIEKETFSLPWSQQGFADSLAQENTCYLVASIGEKLVGYCGFLQVLDEADITNVAVDAACRKCGVGERMLLELLKAGEDRGVRAFTLEVRESNLAALALYQKIGFETCGVRKNFYDFPKENAVIMWKYLQSFPIG